MSDYLCAFSFEMTRMVNDLYIRQSAKKRCAQSQEQCQLRLTEHIDCVAQGLQCRTIRHQNLSGIYGGTSFLHGLMNRYIAYRMSEDTYISGRVELSYRVSEP